MTDQRSFVEGARRASREAIEQLGVPAFGYRFARSHLAAEAIAGYDDAMGEDGPLVRGAGRLVAWRSKGRTVFGHLEDPSGRIQLYFRRDALEDAWPLIDQLDLDDHVGLTGQLFRTRTGEITVRALKFTRFPLRFDRNRPSLPFSRCESVLSGLPERWRAGGMFDVSLLK